MRLRCLSSAVAYARPARPICNLWRMALLLVPIGQAPVPIGFTACRCNVCP